MARYAPTTVVEAYTFEEYASNCALFPQTQLPSPVYIKYPDVLINSCTVVEVKCLETGEPVAFSSPENHPWVDLPEGAADFGVGYHSYMVVFERNYDKAKINLYFCYKVYGTDLEKPYIYMEREDENTGS